jgi:surface protein
MKYLFACLFLFLFVFSCGKTLNSDSKFKRESVTGLIQKGPFINGTRVSLQELTENFTQTGNTFSTEMTSNAGRFEIRNIELESSYALLSASGFYFNEVRGEISEAPLTLNGLVDLSKANTVNLNVITHLQRPRIEYLIDEGLTFSDATEQSRGELLNIFGYLLNSDEVAESFDITQNSETAAILLAISVIMQGNSSTGELSELLANFSDNFRSLGVITNPQILAKLRLNAISLNYETIEENLTKRYQELGESADIPNYREKVTAFLQNTGEPPIINDVNVVNISSQDATITAMVNPNSLLTELILKYGIGQSLSDSVVVSNSPISGENFQKAEVTLTGLFKNTEYSFKLLARNAEGEVTSGDNTLRTLDQFDISIEIEGEGDVTIEVIQAKTTTHEEGTILKLTAIPSSSWRFDSWSGDLSGNQNPLEIIVNSNLQLTAVFGDLFYLAENGATIMCPGSKPGDKGEVNGVEYEAVDRNLLIQRINEEVDLTKVCTSLVTDMSFLFYRITRFNQPIGNWDVSNVTNMQQLFFFTAFNQSLENWDVSSVTNMVWMFGGSNFNQPIESWDVSNVTNMSYMFDDSPFNQPLNNWDVSSVTNMNHLFSYTPFNQPLDKWNVSNVTDIGGMFSHSTFNQPIGNWDVSSVTNMNGMFNDSPFNQPLNNWDVSSVTDMGYMFAGSQFNQPIGNWDVSNVDYMTGMFGYYSNFNQNISNWCVEFITSEPDGFSIDSPLTPENKPIWGTCPER